MYIYRRLLVQSTARYGPSTERLARDDKHSQSPFRVSGTEAYESSTSFLPSDAFLASRKRTS